MAEPLAVNTPAPDFTLTDNKGNEISLQDFREKKNVVLVFLFHGFLENLTFSFGK